MTDSYEDIKKVSEKQLKKGSAEEITDIIYDTLFQNTNFSQFDMKNLTDIHDGVTQEVDRKERKIEFGYMGHIYTIQVSMIK